MRNTGPIVVAASFGCGWLAAHAAISGDSGAAPATHLSAAEIAQAVAELPPEPVGDRAMRTMRIGSYNLSVAVVRRALDGDRLPPDAIVHDKVTEVYQVLEGDGILVTGGRLMNGKALPADDPEVRRVLGPSSVGTRISGGVARRIGAGDMVIIPPNTPHGFVELGGRRIVYTLVRIDGERVLEIGSN